MAAESASADSLGAHTLIGTLDAHPDSVMVRGDSIFKDTTFIGNVVEWEEDDGTSGSGGVAPGNCYVILTVENRDGVWVVVGVRVVYCVPEDPDDPGGGGGGTQTDTLTGKLECDPDGGVERGGDVTCTLSASESSATFSGLQWSFPATGATQSGGTSWGGKAVVSGTMLVTGLVNGTAFEPATAKIDVTPRTWKFRGMTHPAATYSVPPGANAKAWGGYETHIAEWGSPVAGTGPWKGEHFMNKPIQLRGHMYLHPDFNSTGSPHPGANQTCSGVPYSANVLTVNSACGLGGNLNSWKSSVERHEQKHEDGANLCLVNGSAARTALAAMENVTGTNRGNVMNKFEDIFTRFENGDLADATKTKTRTPMSPVIWEWRDNGAWTRQALQPVPHAGATGC